MTGGFLTLLAELLLTHHTEGVQLVAVASTVAGALLCVAALLVSGRARYSLAAIFLLLSVTGLLGAYEHLDQNQERSARFTRTALAASAPNNETSRAQPPNIRNAQFFRPGRSAPPPLAPLSLSGLSLLGVVAVMGKDASAQTDQ